MLPEYKQRWIWRGVTLGAWLVGLLILFASLRGAPLVETWQALRDLSAWQVGVLVLVNGAVLTLFTLRWWLLLRGVGGRVSFFRLFGYRLAAFGVNYFTPGPQFGGEPAQLVLLNQGGGIHSPTAAASITLDKLLELAFNLGFLIWGLFLIVSRGLLPDLLHPQTTGALALVFVLPLLYLGLLWRGRRPLTRLSQRAARRWLHNRAIQKGRRFVYASEKQMVRFLRHKPQVFLGASLLTTAAWGLMVLEFWLSMNFLGIPASLTAALIALTFARLAFLAPTPAGLGVLEAALALSTTALGFGPAAGLGLSLYIRARDILVGAMGLGIMALSIQRIRSHKVQHGMIIHPTITAGSQSEKQTQPISGVGPYG
jgi:glycosyltransferase 2 family protein